MLTMLPLLLLVICLNAILMDNNHFSPFERKSNFRALRMGAKPPLRFWSVVALDIGTLLLTAMLFLGALPASPELDAGTRFWQGLAALFFVFLLSVWWNHRLDLLVETLPRVRRWGIHLLWLAGLGLLLAVALLFSIALIAAPNAGFAVMLFLSALRTVLPAACLLMLGFYLLRLLSFFLRAVPLAGTLLHAAAHTILLTVMMQILGRMIAGGDLPLGANAGLQTHVLTIGLATMGALVLSSFLPGQKKVEAPVQAPSFVAGAPESLQPEISLHDNGGQIACGDTRVEVTYDPFDVCVYGAGGQVLWRLAPGGLRRDVALYSFFSFPIFFTGSLVKTFWRLKGKPIRRPVDMRAEGNKLWVNLWDAQIFVSYQAEAIVRLEIKLRQPSPNWLPEYRALALEWDAPADSHYLGFGQRFDRVDQRGARFFHVQESRGSGYGRLKGLLQPLFGERGAFPGGEHATPFPLPFFLTMQEDGGVIGTFWDSAQPAQVGVARNGRTSLAVLTQELDFYICAGPTGCEVLQRFAALTGQPALPPVWAFLPGKVRGGQADEKGVREDIVLSRRLGISLASVGVEEWENFPGSYLFSPERFAKPEELVKEASEKGYRITASLSAVVAADSEAFQEGIQNGCFVTNRAGMPYMLRSPKGTACLVDYTHPNAAAWQRDLLKTRLLDIGFQGIHVEKAGALPPDAVLADGRSGLEVNHTYPLLTAAALRPSESSLEDEILLSMDSGAAASWRMVQAWRPGSSPGSTDLRSAVRAMLSASLSGVVFQGLNQLSLSFEDDRELFLRWMEASAYTPWMVTRAGQAWSLDPEIVSLVQALSDDHVKLFPYFYSLAKKRLPILRHPALLWQTPREIFEVEDAWMVGDALYVAPFLEKGQTWRPVLLPPGRWWSLAEGKALDGGEAVEAEAFPGCVPLYLRQGYPLLRFAQTFDTFDASDFARQGDLNAALEVWLFKGDAPASFTLFDGSVLTYQDGKPGMEGGKPREVEWNIFEG